LFLKARDHLIDLVNTTFLHQPKGYRELIELIFKLNIKSIKLALATVLTVIVFNFKRLTMGLPQNICALCGKIIEKPEKLVFSEVINGIRFVFDTESCLEMFRKFQIVYGDTFVAQNALET